MTQYARTLLLAAAAAVRTLLDVTVVNLAIPAVGLEQHAAERELRAA